MGAMRSSMASKSRCKSGSFSLTQSPTVVCRDCRCTRPVRSPACMTRSRIRSVRSMNSVASEVANSSRVALTLRPRGKVEASFGQEARASRRQPPLTWIRPPSRRPPGRQEERCRPGCGSRGRGRGRPSEAWWEARRDRPDPGAGCRARSAPRPGRAWPGGPARSAGPRRGSRDRRQPGRLTTGPRDDRARGRAAGHSSNCLYDTAGELAECREGAQAGFVVAGHDVVKPEAEDRIQHEWHQHVARHGQPDSSVYLEPVELLLDHLAVPSEKLGQVGPQSLRPGRLDQQVEGGELDVAEPAQRVPERLDPDLQHLERVGELVEGSAQLLDRLRGQVAPGLHEELGLGWEPVLEVADGDAGLGGDGAEAGAGVAVFEQGIRRRVDDLVSGALSGGRPGHTYVPAY